MILVATHAVSRCRAGTMPLMSVVLGIAAAFRFVDIEHDSVCLERAWKHRFCAADAQRAIEEHLNYSILLTLTSRILPRLQRFTRAFL